MRILLTGGSGFIGRNILELMGTRYNIVAPKTCELDLLDSSAVFDFFKKEKFDVVIHSARWESTPNAIRDQSLILENNLRMFFNLVSCSFAYGRMIYYGSVAEFGRERWIPKMTEDYFGKYLPAEQYGFSKYIMTEYARKTKNIINLRLFGIFGKYEDLKRRFISQACCRTLLNMPIVINRNVFFDYLCVEDLVDITEHFLTNKPQWADYNVCQGKTFKLTELAEKVKHISGKKVDIIIKEPGLGVECSGDNSRLLKELGSFKFREIDQSIKELYFWYGSRIENIDKTLFS